MSFFLSSTVNLGVVVAIPIVGTIFLVAVGIPLVFFAWIYCSSNRKCKSCRKRMSRRRSVVTTTLYPSVQYRRPMVISSPLIDGTSLTASTTLNESTRTSTIEPGTSFTASTLNDSIQPLIIEPKPAEVAEEQEPVHKDAQLSSRDAPPSYNVSNTYPSYKPQVLSLQYTVSQCEMVIGYQCII